MASLSVLAQWNDILIWAGINGVMNECPRSLSVSVQALLSELEEFHKQHSGNPHFPAFQYMLLLTGVQSQLPNDSLNRCALDFVFSTPKETVREMLPTMSKGEQESLYAALEYVQKRIDADEAARAAAARDEADRDAAIAAADEADRVAAIAAADEADRVAAIAAADEADRVAAIAAADEADAVAAIAAAAAKADETTRVTAASHIGYEWWTVEEVESPLQLRRGRFVH
jgi:hypothetical protein